MDIFALILYPAKYHHELEHAKNFFSSVNDVVTLFPENCKLECVIFFYLPFLDFMLKIHSLLE